LLLNAFGRGFDSRRLHHTTVRETRARKRPSPRGSGGFLKVCVFSIGLGALLPAVALGASGARPGTSSPSPASTSRFQEKRIQTVVIDPGHGGTETGAKSPLGVFEKDVNLAIALKLREIIERSQAFQVFLTRDKDVDVSLESRSALANNLKADIFISIHANGSRQRRAEGSETFFLSFDATNEEARRLAYLENNSSQIEERIGTSQEDDIKMILWDMAQTAFLRQSSLLAEIIQSELNILLGTRNRGIQQAPFKVLSGVACPAVLIEVAFLSNPKEEKMLTSADFQTRVADAIYRGLSQFLKLNS
jgi:N-acetylmuramoyl-L-alanine amidase